MSSSTVEKSHEKYRAKRFKIMTIDALGLVHSTSIPETNDTESIFTVDVSEKYPFYVMDEIRNDNALFYQIRSEIMSNTKQSSNNSDDYSTVSYDKYGYTSYDYDPECLKDKLIVVDFSGIFQEMANEQCEIKSVIDAIENDSDETHKNIWCTRLSLLLDSQNGISIKFNDESIHKFIPFDKSASMGKKCRISYIESTIHDRIDERIRLGIEFNNISLILSKYYSYRGLYLTSGARIDQKEGHFKLNEETVIVLPDLKIKPTEDFECTPLIYSRTDEPIPGKKICGFAETEQEIEITAFDGEGLISPYYSSYIQETLGIRANSFQVRMPFTKGMLHTVDFHNFIREKNYGNNCKVPIIKDFLGIERNLEKADIIINESMFKCHDWLMEYSEKHNIADPMKFFFDQMNMYDHSLYVSGSDASFCPTGYEKLNYQFLDTLKLSHEDMITLVNNHMKICKKELRNFLYPDKNKVNKKPSSFKPYIVAAVKNPAFYEEQRLKDNVIQQMYNFRNDCGSGSLHTEGEHRYLSGDLLAYLLYIEALCNDKENINMEFFSNNKGLLKGEFYMPQKMDSKPEDSNSEESKLEGCNSEDSKSKAGIQTSPKLKLENGQYYALFRSPHLSRNEECMLKAYIPNDDNNSDNNSSTNDDSTRSTDYRRYFSNLTGILMVPIGSLAPLILGGADFDGDHCKIYTNEIIVNAVKDGCYDDNYKRKISVVNIPSNDPVKCFPGNEKKYKELIINTFSNYIGEISNLSVAFADNEYSCNDPDDTKKLCALTTAVGGLEIDASKNSGHPMEYIDYLRSKDPANSNGSDFIKFKNEMKKIRGTQSHKVTDKNIQEGTNTVTIYQLAPKIKPRAKKNSKKKDITFDDRQNVKQNIDERTFYIKEPDINVNAIMQLPYQFTKLEYNKEGIKELKKEKIFPKKTKKGNLAKKFIFEEDFSEGNSYYKKYKETRSEDIDAKNITEIENLILAYREILKDIRYANQNRKQKTDTYKKLISLLNIKYDSMTSFIPLESNREVTVSDALELSKNLIDNHFNNREDVNKALDALKKKEWIFCPKDDRKDKLVEILKYKSEEIPEEVSALLTDFNFDGFYILYYVLELVYTSFLNMKTVEERLHDRYKKLCDKASENNSKDVPAENPIEKSNKQSDKPTGEVEDTSNENHEEKSDKQLDELSSGVGNASNENQREKSGKQSGRLSNEALVFYKKLLDIYCDISHTNIATDQMSSENNDNTWDESLPDNDADYDDESEESQDENYNSDESDSDAEIQEEDGPSKDYNDLLDTIYENTITESDTDGKTGMPHNKELFNSWRNKFNSSVFDLLLEIIDKDKILDNLPLKDPNSEKPDLENLALEYAYNARKSVDKSGSFFWEVIPIEVILRNINEVQ